MAHNSLGVALVAQGRLDEALKHYQAAMAIDPQDADPGCNVAGILATQGRVEEAVAGYKKVLEIEPDHVKARSDLGDLLTQLGRLDEAAACYEKALEYQSDDALVHRNLGDLLGRLGRYDEAIAHFQRAVEVRARRRRRPQQSRYGVPGGRKDGTGHDPLPAGPGASGPTTPRPITTSPSRWPTKAASPRRSGIAGRPSSPARQNRLPAAIGLDVGHLPGRILAEW